MFHHVVAVFLFGGSFAMNFIGIASVVAYLHDISDAFCAYLKIAVETEYDWCTRILFVTLMVSWVYTRLVLLPYITYTHDHSHISEDA